MQIKMPPIVPLVLKHPFECHLVLCDNFLESFDVSVGAHDRSLSRLILTESVGRPTAANREPTAWWLRAACCFLAAHNGKSAVDIFLYPCICLFLSFVSLRTRGPHSPKPFVSPSVQLPPLRIVEDARSSETQHVQSWDPCQDPFHGTEPS